ncbi:uncharacterized protein LOC143076467 [Mytilus galloprovincialis]|uniref:uncharacterized protein LOC143076467 n=1 Tax=Mytilus galloprovincialis TaxID=29158 RepID=UPI003F7BDA45
MASSQGVDDMTLEKQTEDTEIEKSDMACSINYSQCLVPKGIDIAKYILQRDSWPREGKHILAQYDDRSVIVYQAFNPAIAKYAVQNQRFGGEQFSYDRMSWIKTNFLWMMYRCGWASKNNQQRVLAVRISRHGFEKILANAFTVKFQREQKLQTDEISVRLQWDPDHSPTYDKLPRKAIQLGLKGEILKTYGTEWIQSITDITDFVKSQKKVLDREGQKDLMTPKERVYNVLDCNTCSRIDLDVFEEGQSRNFGIHSIVKKAEEAAQTKPMPAPSNILCVLGLDFEVETEHLQEMFGKYGPIERVHIVRDKKTGKSRGYAFVEYKTQEDAVKAKEHLHGGHVEGKEITVEFSKSNFKGQDNQDSGTSKPNHWKCQVSGCGNMNFPIRKRCSKCNAPRTKEHNESNTQDGGVPDSAAEPFVRSVGTAEQQGRKDTSGSGKGGRFTVPEDLHIPHGMDVPDTEEQHLVIEKTAKFVAANGIQMEIMIKSKQGNNPKLTFLNLHDPLNFYYNHMVKMIKAGKYTPTDQTKGGDSIGINVPQNTS